MAQPVSEAPFGEFYEASPDAVVVIDQTGHILFANSRVEALLGSLRRKGRCEFSARLFSLWPVSWRSALPMDLLHFPLQLLNSAIKNQMLMEARTPRSPSSRLRISFIHRACGVLVRPQDQGGGR